MAKPEPVKTAYELGVLDGTTITKITMQNIVSVAYGDVFFTLRDKDDATSWFRLEKLAYVKKA